MDGSIKKLSSVSFFCPAYNDEGNLPKLIPSVHRFLKKYAEIFEIKIIHDGSPDNTGAVAEELSKMFPEVVVVHHQKNMGYSATLQEGFESAKYDYVMYTDGDNQYDVFDMEPHIDLLENNDVLTGYATEKAVSFYRKFQSFVHNMLINILFFTYFRDINCALKIFKKSVLDDIDIKSSPYGAFIDAEMILKAKKLGYRIAQFPVTHYERESGIASGSNPKVILNTIKDLLKLRFGLI